MMDAVLKAMAEHGAMHEGQCRELLLESGRTPDEVDTEIQQARAQGLLDTDAEGRLGLTPRGEAAVGA